MSEYKRMVSYLYKYENGAKGRNIGYVRIEVRQGDLKLLVSIKDPKGLNDVSYKVYFYYHEGRRLKGISGGEMLLKRGEGTFRAITKEEAVFKSRYSLDDMGGMIIYYNNELAYGTEWDDHAIQMHYFEADSMAVPPVPKEGNREGAEESIPAGKPAAVMEPANEHPNLTGDQSQSPNQSQSRFNGITPEHMENTEPMQQSGQTGQMRSAQQQSGQNGQMKSAQQQSGQTWQMKSTQQQTDQTRQMRSVQQQSGQTGQMKPAQQQSGQTGQMRSVQQQSGQTSQMRSVQQQSGQTGQMQPTQQQADQSGQSQQVKAAQTSQQSAQQVKASQEIQHARPTQSPQQGQQQGQQPMRSHAMQPQSDQVEWKETNLQGELIGREEAVQETVMNGTSNGGQQRNGNSQPRSVVNLGRMAPQNNQNIENIEAAEVTAEIASEAAVSQEVLKAESLDVNYDSETDHLVVEKRANNQQQNRNKGPQPYGNYWQNDRRQFNNRQQNGRRMRQNQAASIQPEMMIQNGSNTPKNYANQENKGNQNNHTSQDRNNWQAQQAQSSIQSYIMESLMKNHSQGNSSNAASASLQGSNPNEFQSKLEQFTEVIQQMQQVMQPSAAASGQQPRGNSQKQNTTVEASKPVSEPTPELRSVSEAASESAPASEAYAKPKDTKEADTTNSSQLEALFRDCPRLPHGGNNQIIEGVRITPQEIGKLDRSNWKFGNNSFLIHGYYNYHYLMLGRIGNERGEVKEVLGVPGIFDNRAKYMAGQFGFHQFIPAKPTPLNTGAFGYWIVELSRENRI